MKYAEAVKLGIRRIRRPVWANPTAYVFIDSHWFRLFDRITQEAIGEPTPQVLLGCLDETDDYVAYDGPLDKDDKE